MRKLLAAALVSLGLGFAGNASAIVVGGIDFGVLGNASHLEAATVAETVVLAEGDVLQGYGVINQVNGDTTYCAVDANCRLFFYFSGYTVTSFAPDHVEFSGGTISIYYDPGTGGSNTGIDRNLLNFSSPTNVAYIQSLAEWVQLSGHVNGGCDLATSTLCADGTLTGDSLSFTGQGLLDVVLGAFGLAEVQNFWNPSNHPDGLGGFSDIVLGSEGNSDVLNPFDKPSCDDGIETGDWCIQGTSSIRGDTVVVPEPGTLLLLGFGLVGLGIGASRRRKQLA